MWGAENNEKLEKGIDQRKSIEKSLRAQALQQAVVAKLGHMALKGPSLKAIMQKTVRLAADTLQVDQAAILQCKPYAKTFDFVAHIGWETKLIQENSMHVGGKSHAGYTLLTNSPVVVYGLGKEKRFQESFLLKAHGLVSGICVVIHGENLPFGILCVYTKIRRSFTKDEVNFLQSMANVFATVVERKKIEKEFHSKTAILSAVIEGITDAIYLKDLSGKYILINSSGAQVIGKSVEYIIGKTAFDIFPNEVALIIDESDKYIITTKQPLTYEEEVLLQGKKKIFLATKTIYKNKQGQVIGIIGINRDITKSKFMEEELRTSRDQLEIILQGVADSITVQNKNEDIVYANQAATNTLGYDSFQDVYMLRPTKTANNYDLFDEYDNPFPYDRLPSRRALAGELLAEEFIKFKALNTGEERFYLAKARPIFDQFGKALFAVNIFHDVTERRKLENRKDDFISIASHELKTPVTSIKAFIQLLKKKFENEFDKEPYAYLTRVDTQLDKLTKLINNLLDVSKIQLGKLDLQKSFFSISNVIYEVVNDFKVTSEGRKILIKGKATQEVFGDEERIYQVLANFLSNAIKYSSPTSTIILTIKEKKEYAKIAIKDCGIGISKENFLRIFDKFYRVNSKKGETYPGLGIGLFIAAEIIHRHKGEIWVESDINKGSTFYFTLPIMRRRHD